jgi:arylsulfatase A-like enzyme
MITTLLGCLQPPHLDAIPEPDSIGPETALIDEEITEDASEAAGSGVPGVLLIVLDDLGYGDTSLPALTEAIQESDPDWQPDIQTPSLEAFSAEGLSLTSFRTDAPVCAPTRAALMTGLQPHAAGFWSADSYLFGAENQLGLRPGLVLLPELLSDAGFTTSMIGKWHLGEHGTDWDPTGGDDACLAPDTPNARGFDHFFGFLSASHDYTISDTCGELHEGGAALGLSLLGAENCTYTGEHTTEVFTERAIAELEALQDAGDPWFLYVAYNAPHTPIDDGAGWIREAAQSDHPDAAAYAEMVEACESPANRSVEMGGSDYCLLVSHLDLHLGRLLAAAPRDALVIVMSDNGGLEGAGASNAHLRGTKGNIFNGGTVVPMVARGPGLPENMALDVSITSAELFPTILDFAGVEPPTTQSAASFPATCDEELEFETLTLAAESRLDVLRDGAPGCRQEIFQENSGQIGLIRQDEEKGTSWKLLTQLMHVNNDGSKVPSCDPTWMLYDQRLDLEEQTNIFETEPELAQSMMASLVEQLTSLPYAHDSIAWHVCCIEAGGESCEDTCGKCWSPDGDQDEHDDDEDDDEDENEDED